MRIKQTIEIKGVRKYSLAVDRYKEFNGCFNLHPIVDSAIRFGDGLERNVEFGLNKELY